MRTYNGENTGRYIVIYLEKGEKILESIQAEIARLGIRSGIIASGIGSARKIVYHRIGGLTDDPVNEFITVEGPTEIGSIQGLILNGEPHLHISCCDREKSFAGHLEPGCEVQYLAEISILELPDTGLVRRPGAHGISYITREAE
jgi:uncharacterized protein